MQQGGIEPPRKKSTELQSTAMPFCHCCFLPLEGFEPSSSGLQNQYSTIKLKRHIIHYLIYDYKVLTYQY